MPDPGLQFDVVIVGGGPAGIASACAARESGKSVALLDSTPWLGGQIWRGHPADSGGRLALCWLAKARECGATLLTSTTVVASPEHGQLLAEDRQGSRLIGWKTLIVATGARELFLPFPGWTLSGVIGPGGLHGMVKHGWPVSGKRVVISGTGPLLLAAADGLQQHGAEIVCIAEQASLPRLGGFACKLCQHPGKILQGLGIKFRLAGVPYRTGTWVTMAIGEEQVTGVELTNGSRRWTERCDLLASGYGLVPNVELALALGCELDAGFVRVNRFQETSVPNIYCAGEPNGICGAEGALVQGQVAGYAASGNIAKAESFFKALDRWHVFRSALASAFALRPELKTLASEETLLCRCEDVAFGRVKNFGDWRSAKLQTRCGMGACQGRICGAAAKVVFGWGMESVRPPVLPARVSTLMTTTKSNM